jgi:hypothetical protein
MRGEKPRPRLDSLRFRCIPPSQEGPRHVPPHPHLSSFHGTRSRLVRCRCCVLRISGVGMSRYSAQSLGFVQIRLSRAGSSRGNSPRDLPPRPNGRGNGLLSRPLRVRIPPGVPEASERLGEHITSHQSHGRGHCGWQAVSSVLAGNTAGDSSPPLPPCGCSSVGRARPCRGRGRGFEPLHPLRATKRRHAGVAQWVERLPSKQEARGSSPRTCTRSRANSNRKKEHAEATKHYSKACMTG